jgi:two-component system chemotaxis response regulator CheB
VIGTSAGGVAALSRIFRDIPANFPGAILVVLHVRERAEKSYLAELLASMAHIPVKVAEAGEVIRQGTAYIAPAGTHLLTKRNRIELGTGPHEERARPSIDALFRSAARTFGPRVIGVVLTGMLRDGARGLRLIRDAGGITIVQNPHEAEWPEMPRTAMEGSNVDYVLELSEIGPLLDLLVRRAGSMKKGVLETGLASSVRLMKDRLRLLAKLREQSRENPKTEGFIEAEIAALDREIGVIQSLIPGDADDA